MTEADPFPYNSQLDAFTLYHIVNESNAKSSVGGGPALPALGHALAGSVGSATAKAVVYPIALVVTRLQVQKQLRAKGETKSAARDADAEYTGLLDAARKIYRNEGGLRAFFAGCTSDVGKGIVDSFLFFLAYSWLQDQRLKKRNAKHLSIPEDLGVGVIAGCFSKFVTTPIQNIVTRQQTAALIAARDPEAASSSESDPESISDIAKSIYEDRGLTGFWAGYGAAVILTINPAITFAADNVLKQLLPKSQQEKPSPQLTFLLAALSKAIATSITYPVQLAKSRAQAAGHQEDDEGEDDGKEGEKDEEGMAGSSVAWVEKPDDSDSSNSSPDRRRRQTKRGMKKLFSLLSAQYTIYLSLRKLYRDEGLAGLYSGLEGDILKGFLSHGLTMMMKENVHVTIIQLYYVLLKLTRRWPEELRKAQERAQEGIEQASKAVAEGSQAVVDEAQKIVEETKKRTGLGE